LYDALKNWVGSDDMSRKYNAGGEFLPIIPSSNLYIPVDKEKVLKSGLVPADEAATIVDSIALPINRSYLLKNDLAVLATIAASNWERPIYFTSQFGELGFGNYLRRDGMAYRLVPVADEQNVNAGWAYEKLMKEFRFGNADKNGVYFDEENRRHLNNIRQAYADVALNLAGKGKMDSARQLLKRVDAGMLQSNLPYGLVSRYNLHNQTSIMLLEAAYRAGEKDLVKKISDSVKKDLSEQMAYYEAIGERRSEALFMEIQYAQRLQSMMEQLEKFMQEMNPEKPAVINPADSQ
jgi:hypothetical protein